MHSFSQLLGRLADAGLDFVIVGGFAAVSHGSAYVTQDVDICILFSEENVAKLRQALKELHPYHRMLPGQLSFLSEPQAAEPLANLYLKTDFGMIDVLSTVLGIGDFHRLRQAADKLEIDGPIK